MKHFLQYLLERWRTAAALLLCAWVFAASFALYHLPLKAVLYPVLLSVVTLLALGAYDAHLSGQKHVLLRRYGEHLSGELPRVDTALDRDYQQILRLMQEEQQRRESLSAERYRDMTEYYTLWAHQIKTPMASMRLALQNEDTPQARRLKGDLGRIEQYVEMVLVFLRLDGDSTDYVIRRCDLDTILRGAVKKFAPEFIDRKLRLEYAPVHEMVLTDEKWLSFVIEQVLSNALKYTPEGSVSITLEPGKVLCIRDTGMGIAPDDLPRIFDRGYTGYHGREDQSASGIGLYLCKRICQNLGHTITAESQPGEGTAIRIDLYEAQLEIE